ncbi:thioredoxin domain-containing protein, partial [Candidatus Uhrbacteria bacterium]|nr:thioredoxin domain-containing protein [Candidatus Uhrbacteria bacterium]
MRRWPVIIFATIGIAALIAMWPARTPTPDPPSQPLSLVPLPSSLFPPTIFPTDPIRGNPSAPLTIIEFADFTCPACADVQGVLTALRAKQSGRDLAVELQFEDPKDPFVLQILSQKDSPE